MIDKELLRQSVEKAVADTDLFIVDIKVSPQNSITVELDSPGSIDIDTCASVTRAIEKDFDRDVEDYDLEVGSAGLTAPFKVRGQYLKNIGNDIEMLRYAGCGIAMGGSSPEVQAAADYITDNVDNDGILKALVRFGVLER